MNKLDLIKEIRNRVQMDPYWKKQLDLFQSDWKAPYTIHLAVFVEPYLEYVLSGKKTIESRFSMKRSAPYGRVNVGDVILLKKSGGPLLGLCKVKNVWSYHLDSKSWKEIRRGYTKELCAQNPEFWKSRKRASYATLMQIDRVYAIHPFNVDKKDRRGWVILSGDETLPLITEES